MPRTKKKDDKVIEVVDYKEEDHNNENLKPYFFPRLVAYIIDILLVSFVCTGLLFFLPKNKNYDKYMEEYKQIQTEWIEGKIPSDEYFHKSIDVVYDIDYSAVVSMIIKDVIIILYFVVFQFYNKGQTFGKKLMKLRIVSADNSDLTLNQVTYHAIIINSILINILMLGAVLLLGRNYYFYANMALQFLDITVVFITLMMILFRKDGRGLHDIIAGTKVIQEN